MGILDNRVAIITGAGGGLGAAHAKVFAAEGCSVVVNDINEAAAQTVVDEIAASGGRGPQRADTRRQFACQGELVNI